MNKKQNSNLCLFVLNIDCNFGNRIVMYVIRTKTAQTFYVNLTVV